MPSNHLILCRPLLLLPPIPSQHQGLFQWVSSWHQVAKVLEFQLQHQSFQWTPRTDLLQDAVKIRSYWLRMAPNPMTAKLIRRKNWYSLPVLQTGRSYPAMKKAETGGACLQAKEHQGLLTVPQSWDTVGGRFSLRASRTAVPSAFISGQLLRVVLRHPFCGTWLQQPAQTHTNPQSPLAHLILTTPSTSKARFHLGFHSSPGP